MKTKFLFLWLEAPLQSWGSDSKFGRRETLEFPTKSGILGLVCCALGAIGEQKELLAEFAGLKQIAISFQFSKQSNEGHLRDFHMIGSGYDGNDPWQSLLIPKTGDGKPAVGGGTKITHRFYLQDAKFAVILEVSEHIADTVCNALQNPVYDIYLGRKCCAPSEFIYQGCYPSKEDTEKAIAVFTKDRSDSENFLVEVFRVVDGESSEGDTFTLNDVPVQFGKVKKYRDRRVTKIIYARE